MTYRFLTPATCEITDAAEYYDDQSAGLGAEFLDELEAAISRILLFPEAWSMLATPFRHCPLRRFPYVIIYSLVSDQEILIVSVFHQKREPLSWKRHL